MRKIIVVGGLPATGKSTLFKRFIAESPHAITTRPFLDSEYPLVNGYEDVVSSLYVLGKDYEKDETFPGTDRFSMAVQPQAQEFVASTTNNILLEGDRLFNASFLEFCSNLPDTQLEILIITADKRIIDERHVIRKDNQSEKFKRGRVTKIDNICSNFILMGYIKTVSNNTPEEQQAILEYLQNQLQGNNNADSDQG